MFLVKRDYSLLFVYKESALESVTKKHSLIVNINTLKHEEKNNRSYFFKKLEGMEVSFPHF